MTNPPNQEDFPPEEKTTDDIAPELLATLQAAASGPHEKIVALLRERRVSITALLMAACKMSDSKQQLALYLALVEVRPSVPVAVDELSGYGRTNYVSVRSGAAACALTLGDVALASSLLEPVIGLAREFPHIAHNAACAFARSGRTEEALAQVKLAAESGYGRILDLEVDTDLEPLYGLRAFQEIFREVKDQMARSALSQWPADVPVPPRLFELARYLTSGDAGGSIDDFEFGSLKDDYLAKMWAQDESDFFLRDFEQHPVPIAFFMHDGGGGQLGLWMLGDPPNWRVVEITHEGSHEVLGDDLDDFLRRMAGKVKAAAEEEEDPDIKEWHENLLAWVSSLGLEPYGDPNERLEHFARQTLEFKRWCAEQQRAIRARVFPQQPLRFVAVPGEHVGPIRLGALQAEVDAALGTPWYASWEQKDDPEQTAFYPASPYVVTYQRSTRRVEEVTIYASWPIVALPGGFEPLLATLQEAEDWLRSQGQAFQDDGSKLICPGLGLSLGLTSGSGAGWRHPASRWVDGITFNHPAA
jgi:hypothetical protein